MGAETLAPYPSPTERERQLDHWTARAGGEVLTYGTSVAGVPLRAARVPTLDPSGPTRRILCTANIHGPEFIGSRVAMALLTALADDAPEAAVRLRRRAEIWIIPCLNPDGYERTHRRGGQGPLSRLRPNDRGVDLNRNFPLPWGRPSRLRAAGSDRLGDATYRGPTPLSEPETAALDRLLGRYPMHASANLHSFMGTIIPARVVDRPSFGTYKRLCRAFGQGQPRRRYWRVSHRRFDVFTGELEDHQHHVHGTWAACIECFPLTASLRQHVRPPSTFWRFNPRDPAQWIANDLPGVIAFLAAALDEPAVPVSA